MRILLTLTLIGFCGCSMMATQDYNRRMDQKVLMMQMSHKGEATLGVDLAAINKGYLSAWQNEPGRMLLSTLADAAIAGSAYWLYQEVNENPTSQPVYTSDGTIITITDNNWVIIIGDDNKRDEDYD